MRVFSTTDAVSVTAADDRDRGLSLVELIVSISLMALAFVAILAALGTMLRSQSQQETIITTDSNLRTYTEGLLALPYVNCASSYTLAAPTGFTTSVAITYWNGDVPPTFTASCPGTGDKLVQQLVVTLTRTSDGWTDSLTAVKTP